MRPRTILPLLALTLIVAPTLPAQSGAPRPLAQSDFDDWKSIAAPALSPDGQWTAWTLAPQVGNGDLVIRATSGTAEHRFSRGYVGRPELRPSADSGFRVPSAVWSADSRTLAFTIFPPRDSVEGLPTRGRGRASAPRNRLGIWQARTGELETVDRVRSFRMARESGRYLAWLLEADSASRTPADSNGAAPARRRGSEPGTTLVLRDLETGTETRIPDVRSFALEDSARYLAYSVSSRSADSNGVYLRALPSGTVTPLLAGPGTYGQAVFARSGAQVAFVSSRGDTTASPQRSLYVTSLTPRGATTQVVATPDSTGEGMQIAERGRLEFVRDGSALVFSLAPVLPDSVPLDSLRDKAILDLWHYRDARLQPQQRVQARRDRNATYAAVWQPRLRRVIALGSPDLPQVSVANDGRTALGVTGEPYRIEAMWGEGGNDIHVINAETGEHRQVATRARVGGSLSPGGRYALWFDKGTWFSHDVRRGTTAPLNSAAPDVRFDRETWDTPSEPAPWGVAGWTRNDGSVLLYDRYDIWEFDPAGVRPPRVITDSAGRTGQITFRLVDLDRDDPWIAEDEDLLLSAFHDITKQSGFWTDRIDRRAVPPSRIVMSDHAWGTPSRARKGTMMTVTRSTFREFPDLWAGERLDRLTRISDANPQQAGIRWGDVELVSWHSDDGVPLQGMLFTPDDFDPSKQYPMVVYFYEKLSDNLHNYVMTHPRNTVQPTWYVSNGYLVFMPDIAYTTGYPGPDAEKAIVPGVQSLLARGFVKPDGIGIAGQSWGGYQTAFLITRSNLFSAAMAGAPVANMTSAYGGIRWQSGLARLFQYEKTQSRIGGSLWEYPLRYLENSPLFSADRIQTPLLMMHNDADGAVPWYQGIEMFVALRRLQREVYLLNYNGDAHNPTKRANQADIARRTMEFFDHHLRGLPAPAWMTDGIPYLDKGRDQVRVVDPLMP